MASGRVPKTVSTLSRSDVAALPVGETSTRDYLNENFATKLGTLEFADWLPGAGSRSPRLTRIVSLLPRTHWWQCDRPLGRSSTLRVVGADEKFAVWVGRVTETTTCQEGAQVLQLQRFHSRQRTLPQSYGSRKLPPILKGTSGMQQRQPPDR